MASLSNLKSRNVLEERSWSEWTVCCPLELHGGPSVKREAGYVLCAIQVVQAVCMVTTVLHWLIQMYQGIWNDKMNWGTNSRHYSECSGVIVMLRRTHHVCHIKSDLVPLWSMPRSKLSCSLLGWSLLSSFCRDSGREMSWSSDNRLQIILYTGLKLVWDPVSRIK